MGAKLRIVYREESGLIHTRVRFSGAMVRYLKSHRVAECDHAHMMDFFDNKNRYDIHVEVEATQRWAAPDASSIVVVDFMAKQIMSAQCYTSLQRIAPAEATGRFYRPEDRAECIKFFTDMPDHRLSIKRRTYRTFQKHTTHEETIGEPLTSAQAHIEAERMMQEYCTQNSPFRERVDSMVEPVYHVDENFHLSFAPLDQSLLCQENDTTSLLLIKTRMLETGFEFTADEQKAWDISIANTMKRGY